MPKRVPTNFVFTRKAAITKRAQGQENHRFVKHKQNFSVSGLAFCIFDPEATGETGELWATGHSLLGRSFFLGYPLDTVLVGRFVSISCFRCTADSIFCTWREGASLKHDKVTASTLLLLVHFLGGLFTTCF